MLMRMGFKGKEEFKIQIINPQMTKISVHKSKDTSGNILPLAFSILPFKCKVSTVAGVLFN
jgi:hypothetical protein